MIIDDPALREEAAIYAQDLANQLSDGTDCILILRRGNMVCMTSSLDKHPALLLDLLESTLEHARAKVGH